MDLSQLDVQEGCSTLVLRHPVTDEPLIDEETKEEVSIDLLGVESKKMQSVQHRLANARLSKGMKGGKLKITAEQLEASSLDLLTEATVGWKHIKVDGNKPPCTSENIRMVYKRFPFVVEQVDEFITDRANHLGNSRVTS